MDQAGTGTGNSTAEIPASLTLSELGAGRTASVVCLDGGRGFREKMNGMGLFPGTEITVVHTSGNGGMMLISIGSSRLMVGHQMAERILMREVI
ncbi:MAG: ferrous iron transport protein A [Candidatus Sabulitectum sp.]|nr:ferrous iron transport protein A [Candidatus Sabulitectum sp.]